MCCLNLWRNKFLQPEVLQKALEDKNTFAVGKTVYEWLNGEYVDGNSHYVLIIKEYSPGKWRVHDPGLPGIANRKVPQNINGQNIFGDILLVRGYLESVPISNRKLESVCYNFLQ